MVERTRREQAEILDGLVRFLAVASLVAYVPSMWASITERLYAVGIVDTLAYALVVLLAVRPRLPFPLKLGFVISGSLAIGIVVLVFTGPYGAGYVWFLAAAVLSALLGQNTFIIASIAASAILMGLWALAIALGATSYGSTPMSIGIIGSNLVLICLALATVIRGLVRRLDVALGESQDYAARLSAQLDDTLLIKAELERSVDEKDGLLRELHHRVRNNLQVVLSILSLGRSDEPDAATTAVRRIRALVLANDLAMDRPELLGVEAADLFRLVLELEPVEQSAKDILAAARRDASRRDFADGGLRGLILDPQTAALAAICLADAFAALGRTTTRLSLRLSTLDARPCVELRVAPEADALLVSAGIDVFLAGALPRSLGRKLRFDRAKAESELGPGIALRF